MFLSNYDSVKLDEIVLQYNQIRMFKGRIMTKIRFGVDIDGTITRPDTILPYINKDFKTELKLEDITEYNIRKFVDVDEQTMYQWFRSNEEIIYRNSPLKDDSKQILNTWAEQLAELFFISARNASLMDITKEWFIYHQLTYSHLELIGSHNKIETIRAYHKELQQAKQTNSISQLAASIAHEIRNPITVVKGFAQLLEQDQNLGEKQKEYVKSILNELDYTQLIITDYLSLAKPQSVKIQALELNAEIQKVTDLLMNFAQQQNINISLSLNDEILVKIDPIELKQVLVNIIKNGIESMKAYSIIKIESHQVGNMAKIIITDQGIGMTPEQVNQLGTPFYSLKDCGTGIGLTVCYNIIHKYKGEIKVMSELGVGTTFTIYLPLYENKKSTTA